MILTHGYTLADLHSLARIAVHTAGPLGMDWHDRFDLAYSAIAEHLYAAAEWPHRHELVSAGQRAIHDAVSAYLRHHGYYKARTLGAKAGPGSSPAFARYWYTAAAPFEETIVDGLTVLAILPTLTARQHNAVGALATVQDYHGAARVLGIQPQTFRALLGRARRQFFGLWHEGEVPSRPWGTDRRVARHANGAPCAHTPATPASTTTALPSVDSGG